MEKSEFLNGLQEEYRQWEALLNQFDPAHMDEPGVAGHWSIKDIIAHLTGWRRRAVARIEAAQRGEPEPPPPWPADLQNDDEINAWIYESTHGRSVHEVLDESHQVFRQLFTAIEGVPEQVLLDPQTYIPWWDYPPFDPAGFFGHFHDEHESDMRAWLARRGLE